MPTENNAAAPDPKDVRISDLEKQVKDLTDDLNQLNEHIDEVELGHESEVKSLRDQLARKSEVGAFTGDFVFLEGKQYPVVKTVRANTTFDEVKKGNVDEGVTLVVIERPH